VDPSLLGMQALAQSGVGFLEVPAVLGSVVFVVGLGLTFPYLWAQGARRGDGAP
jgi:hypothetical protein